MTTTAIFLFAAMLTTGLLTGIKNSCKRGYIIPDRFDIHCEIKAVPFGELSKNGTWRAGSEKVQSMHIAEAKG